MSNVLLARWLKLGLNLKRSFTSYTLWTEKMEFDFTLINGDILLLNSLYESIFWKSRLRPFHVLMQYGKNDARETLVLQIGSSRYIWVDHLVLWFFSLVVYYFLEKKSDFRYHFLAENHSRFSFAYILSILVPRIARVFAKHALYCTLSNFDTKFTLRGYIIIYCICAI